MGGSVFPNKSEQAKRECFTNFFGYAAFFLEYAIALLFAKSGQGGQVPCPYWRWIYD